MNSHIGVWSAVWAASAATMRTGKRHWKYSRGKRQTWPQRMMRHTRTLSPNATCVGAVWKGVPSAKGDGHQSRVTQCLVHRRRVPELAPAMALLAAADLGPVSAPVTSGSAPTAIRVLTPERERPVLEAFVYHQYQAPGTLNWRAVAPGLRRQRGQARVAQQVEARGPRRAAVQGHPQLQRQDRADRRLRAQRREDRQRGAARSRLPRRLAARGSARTRAGRWERQPRRRGAAPGPPPLPGPARGGPHRGGNLRCLYLGPRVASEAYRVMFEKRLPRSRRVPVGTRAQRLARFLASRDAAVVFSRVE